MKMVSWMWKWGSKQPDDINEDDLKKGGFDPTQVQDQQIKQAKQEPIMDFNTDYDGFIMPSKQEALQLINSYKFVNNEEDHRHELAHSKGGKICGNKLQVAKIRSIGKQMIKTLGKKLISGDFNLTRISFPIKAMVPKTALENSTLGLSTMPYFMKCACQANDPVQKMKFSLTAIVSSFYYMNLFLKPLNPVIGETLQATYSDGSAIYCEQISHHPPISQFLMIGPNNQYRYSGSYNFQATAGLNSMTLFNRGSRLLQFQNGDKITGNFAKQTYCGVFLGTLRSQNVGEFQLIDQKNGLKCEVKFGKVKKRPSDYFTGQITKNGKGVSKFDGTYCGYLNFDGVRYWDGRCLKPFRIILQQKPLESDFRNRQDLQLLKDGKIHEAQIAKQKIQVFQRRDRKLRQQNQKQKNKKK